jgi:hydrogenase expression/formation protein HypE
MNPPDIRPSAAGPPISPEAFHCPVPGVGTGTRTIQLAHGGGGSLTQQLVEHTILPRFRNAALGAEHDGAVLACPPSSDGGPVRLAFTTDGHVVRPLEFPGGNIGSLAVHGTVNDLAMCGARPRWLSASLILEEGLPFEVLERVLEAMADAARQSGVELVTGDTKVVDRGHGDGIYIATSGIGIVEAKTPIEPRSVREGDVILVSGDLGRHGIAILSVREGLNFETPILSDVAPLTAPVLDLLHSGVGIHCLRDLTRGGLAAALHEIAVTSDLGVEIDETSIPIGDPVRAACEVLGLDPLHIANEGRFVAFVPEPQAGQALAVMQRHSVSSGACRIGRVTARGPAPVQIRTSLGILRVLARLSGESLPRIC